MLGLIIAIMAAASPAPDFKLSPEPVVVNAPPAPKLKPRPDPDKTVCRTVPVPGSAIPVRSCLPRREWQERTAREQQALRQIQKGFCVGQGC